MTLSSIDVLTVEPSGEELYEGRIWIYQEPTYAEVVEADTLSQPNQEITGAATFGDYTYKNSYVYIPPSDMHLTRIDLKMKSRSSTLHTTANNIRLQICTDDGTGKPNLSDVLATKVLTCNPLTPDTEFIATAIIATDIDNFASKIPLSAGQRYHFVMDIPTGSGKSFYSGLINRYGTLIDPYAQTNYTTDWFVNNNNIPCYKIYKAVEV